MVGSRKVAALALVVCAGCREYLVDPSYEEPELDYQFRVTGRLDAGEFAMLPPGPLYLAAVRVDVRGDGAPVIGGLWRQTAIEDGEFELVLPRRPAFAELYPPDDEAGSFRVASYMLGAYVDVNESGEPDEGDVLVGASTDLIVFADGERTHMTEGVEYPPGWNRVEWRIDGEDSRVFVLGWGGHLEGLEMPANLMAPPRDKGLRGEVRSPIGPVRVDLYAITEQYVGERRPNSTLLSVDVDASAANTPFLFAGPIPEPPPEHLFANGDVSGAEISVAVALAYEDVDQDGVFDADTDPTRGSSLDAGGDARMLIYVKPLDFTAAFYEQVYGLASGWMLCDARGDEATRVDWQLGVVVDATR
jgi:hypothetical protein